MMHGGGFDDDFGQGGAAGAAEGGGGNLDPHLPMMQLFLQSFLPWNRVLRADEADNLNLQDLDARRGGGEEGGLAWGEEENDDEDEDALLARAMALSLEGSDDASGARCETHTSGSDINSINAEDGSEREK